LHMRTTEQSIKDQVTAAAPPPITISSASDGGDQGAWLRFGGP
jgi:hypothetical protein